MDIVAFVIGFGIYVGIDIVRIQLLKFLEKHGVLVPRCSGDSIPLYVVFAKILQIP